jgi:3-hydroxyisobutyrate dehydrogenase
MSTTEIAQLRRLSLVLAARGAATLESPVTGGVDNAWRGKVTMFVAGERGEFERCRPVFEGIGDRALYMGPLGSGMTTKLITNMLCFVHQAALAEGLVLGAKAGLELPSLWRAIGASYGGSFVCEHDVPKIFDGSYDPSFTLDLVCKDAGLTLDLARALGVPMEVATLVEGICNRARARYGGKQGNLHTARLLEDATGVSLRARID